MRDHIGGADESPGPFCGLILRRLSRLDLRPMPHDLSQLGLESFLVFVAPEVARHLAEPLDLGFGVRVGGFAGWHDF